MLKINEGGETYSHVEIEEVRVGVVYECRLVCMLTQPPLIGCL
jgi:hypothetical protein